MAANLTDVMGEIADRVATIAGLNVYGFPPDSAPPPFAFVNMPDTITYDYSMRRGADRFSLEVWVGVGRTLDEVVAGELMAYAAGAGSLSVKAAIDASTMYDLRVSQVTFSAIGLAAGVYAGAIFTVDVVA